MRTPEQEAKWQESIRNTAREMMDEYHNQPKVYKTFDGNELAGQYSNPPNWTIGWQETPNGREMVKWCAHFGCWLNREDYEQIPEYRNRRWEELGGRTFRGERFGYLTDAEYITRLEQEPGIKKG